MLKSYIAKTEKSIREEWVMEATVAVTREAEHSGPYHDQDWRRRSRETVHQKVKYEIETTCEQAVVVYECKYCKTTRDVPLPQICRESGRKRIG